MATLERLEKLWYELYEDVEGLKKDDLARQFTVFMDGLSKAKKQHFLNDVETEGDWYKDAVIYSAYVDLFNKDFNGLKG